VTPGKSTTSRTGSSGSTAGTWIRSRPAARMLFCSTSWTRSSPDSDNPHLRIRPTVCTTGARSTPPVGESLPFRSRARPCGQSGGGAGQSLAGALPQGSEKGCRSGPVVRGFPGGDGSRSIPWESTSRSFHCASLRRVRSQSFALFMELDTLDVAVVAGADPVPILHRPRTRPHICCSGCSRPRGRRSVPRKTTDAWACRWQWCGPGRASDGARAWSRPIRLPGSTDG